MIELATSAAMLFSVFYGTASASTQPTVSAPKAIEVQTEDPRIVDEVALLAPTGNSKTVEGDVRAYFTDTPILAEIAKCESRFTHVGQSGNIIRGKVNKSDIGVMQINTYYHGAEAKKLGIDLMTLEGNMAYAKHLYDKEGSAPWVSSSKCWGKYEVIAKN